MAKDDRLIELRNLVRVLRLQGRKTVAITNLEKVLEELAIEESEPSETKELALTQFKEAAEQERSLAHYSATNRWNVAELAIVAQLGQGTLKNAILINGGGAAALLAFIGHVWGPTSRSTIVLLSWPLFCFVLGVVAAAFASAIACLAEGAGFAEDIAMVDDKPKLSLTSKRLAWLTVFLVICSFILFSLGCTQAYIAFTV